MGEDLLRLIVFLLVGLLVASLLYNWLKHNDYWD